MQDPNEIGNSGNRNRYTISKSLQKLISGWLEPNTGKLSKTEQPLKDKFSEFNQSLSGLIEKYKKISANETDEKIKKDLEKLDKEQEELIKKYIDELQTLKLEKNIGARNGLIKTIQKEIETMTPTIKANLNLPPVNTNTSQPNQINNLQNDMAAGNRNYTNDPSIPPPPPMPSMLSMQATRRGSLADAARPKTKMEATGIKMNNEIWKEIQSTIKSAYENVTSTEKSITVKKCILDRTDDGFKVTSPNPPDVPTVVDLFKKAALKTGLDACIINEGVDPKVCADTIIELNKAPNSFKAVITPATLKALQSNGSKECREAVEIYRKQNPQQPEAERKDGLDLRGSKLT